jgi:hypothetical protein
MLQFFKVELNNLCLALHASDHFSVVEGSAKTFEHLATNFVLQHANFSFSFYHLQASHSIQNG